jgi:hypothetical protein
MVKHSPWSSDRWPCVSTLGRKHGMDRKTHKETDSCRLHFQSVLQNDLFVLLATTKRLRSHSFSRQHGSLALNRPFLGLPYSQEFTVTTSQMVPLETARNVGAVWRAPQVSAAQVEFFFVLLFLVLKSLLCFYKEISGFTL